jgi:hypothetical protein
MSVGKSKRDGMYMTGFVNKSRVLWGHRCFWWIAFLLFCTVQNVNSATLWYGGDTNAGSSFNNTLLVAQNGAGFGDTVLTEFVVTDPNGWHVTGLFSNNIADYPFGNAPFDKAVWSIRTGAGINEPGNIIFAGLSTAIINPTGRFFWGDDVEYNVMVSGLEINLDPGVYTMNVSPLAPSQFYYVGDSDGTNAVGKRGPNGSFQDESFIVNGVIERNVKNFPHRVSMGIIGTGSTIGAEIPLPNSALLFIWGLLSLFLFRGFMPQSDNRILD